MAQKRKRSLCLRQGASNEPANGSQTAQRPSGNQTHRAFLCVVSWIPFPEACISPLICRFGGEIPAVSRRIPEGGLCGSTSGAVFYLFFSLLSGWKGSIGVWSIYRGVEFFYRRDGTDLETHRWHHGLGATQVVLFPPARQP